ncbi:hypothetical protein [Mycolicibacterium llatzerense]|uniref:hypothetical protein n=1 Tax=Mycolicibacterium llatzerense TaxID=280871 RepID=UPI0031D74F6E
MIEHAVWVNLSRSIAVQTPANPTVRVVDCHLELGLHRCQELGDVGERRVTIAALVTEYENLPGLPIDVHQHFVLAVAHAAGSCFPGLKT